MENKVKQKYSDYVLSKAKKSKVKFTCSSNCFTVNDKYEVRLNQRTKRWMCTCKFASDGKTKTIYCSHVLGIMYNLDKYAYRKETEWD